VPGGFSVRAIGRVRSERDAVPGLYSLFPELGFPFNCVGCLSHVS
jgi:hypothetical protein